MLVAAQGLPSLRTIVLILACMVCARTSAMAFNRFIDADIDARNPRTRSRHIPSGLLSKAYVLSLAIASGAAFILAAYFLNFLAAALSPLALAIIWLYSFTKRWTYYTQLFLGYPWQSHRSEHGLQSPVSSPGHPCYWAALSPFGSPASISIMQRKIMTLTK